MRPGKLTRRLAALGVFEPPTDRVCEIGPGSGRYLEKTMDACHPGYYEVYETSKGWAGYLAAEYGVHCRPCDGKTLRGTPSRSIDLVQAHKVFGGLLFPTVFSYLAEMARVSREGGRIVFDVISDTCIDEGTLSAWVNQGIERWNWVPQLMPRELVIHFMEARGAGLVGNFFSPLFPGQGRVPGLPPRRSAMSSTGRLFGPTVYAMVVFLSLLLPGCRLPSVSPVNVDAPTFSPSRACTAATSRSPSPVEPRGRRSTTRRTEVPPVSPQQSMQRQSWSPGTEPSRRSAQSR